MTEELRNKIASLRAVTPKLNASTTEAGKVIQEVEALLDELGVGIPAEVQADTGKVFVDDDDNDRKVEPSSWLGYERLAGKFRIVVTRKFYTDDDGDGNYETLQGDDGAVAWGSLPRNMKLKSFAALPALLDQIATEAQFLTEVADKTVKEVRNVLGNTHDEATDKLVFAIETYEEAAEMMRGLSTITDDNQRQYDAAERLLWTLLPDTDEDEDTPGVHAGVNPVSALVYNDRVYARRWGDSQSDEASVFVGSIVRTIHGTPAPKAEVEPKAHRGSRGPDGVPRRMGD